MSSDRLIDALAADLAPVRARNVWRDAAVLALIGGIEIALFVAFGAMRPDMERAMTLPGFWWKLASLAVLTVIGVTTALRAFDPAASPRRGLHALTIVAVSALATGVMIDAVRRNPVPLLDRLMVPHGLECVIATLALSLPPLVALGLMMRRGAPTDRRGTALAIGIASAAWGALVFVLACPHDDPLYIAVWYPIGCGTVALAARLILPRMARW